MPLRRLDQLVDAVTDHVQDPRTFLKLDMKGYDVGVFAGLDDRSSLLGMQSEVALLQIYQDVPRLQQALTTSTRPLASA